MATTLLSDVWNSSLSTGTSAGSEGPSLHSLPLYKVNMYIWVICAPIILRLGNFGNIMTIVIMQKMTSGKSVVDIYFTGLAIIDLVVLDIFLSGQWSAIVFLFWPADESKTLCKIYNWIITGSTTISAWFLVCLTVHRALSVVWPHRVNLLCTLQRVTVLLIGIVAFFAAVYSHNLYGYNLVYVDTIGRYSCVMTVTYAEFMEDVFTYVDLVFYCLLPFVCLTLANGVLVWKLRASVRESRHTLAEGGTDQTEGRQKTARSVTLTVILVSSAFIVLTLPASLFYVMFYVALLSVGKMSIYHYAELDLVLAVTYILMFSNNAVNFYLYCLTGQRFREEFIKILSCGRVIKPLGALSLSKESSKKSTHR